MINLQQHSIDLMSEHLFGQLQFHADNDDLQSVHAIYSEWCVDGKDPEDGSYQFIFIDHLQSL